MKKRVFSIVLAAMLIFSLSACGGSLSNKDVQKMIAKSDGFYDLDTASAKVISEAEAGKSKLVLFSARGVESGDLVHSIAILDTKNDTLSPIEFAYPPLQYLNDEITLNRHQNINEKYFQKIAEYMGDNENFFDDEESSTEFLRQITSDDAPLSTNASQKAIENFAKAQFGIEDDEFCGVFEEGTANPLCFASPSTESIYSYTYN